MRQHTAEIEALNGRVVAVSFATPPQARLWLAETSAPVFMLLDPDQAAYRAYGLERSLRRAWGLRVWLRYAQLLLAGRRWRGIQGDSAQLGGDFIIDPAGKICLAHPSADPDDRPAIDLLLKTLASCSATATGN